MGIQRDIFGKTPEGEEVERYTLQNATGAQLQVMTYGATVTRFLVPSRGGALTDVCLGYPTFEGYLKNGGYVGAFVGRVCNRIKAGKFTLNGQVYTLAKNDGPNHLHGGVKGFSFKNWKASPMELNNEVTFAYVAADGEEGYPGRVETYVTYQLTPDNALRVKISAKSLDVPTLVELTSHVYFNLSGMQTSNIRNHDIQILADKCLVTDENSLVTGEIVNVEDTPFDLRERCFLGNRLRLLSKEGFDNYYICGDQKHQEEREIANVWCEKTGIKLTVSSTTAGVQFYTAQFLTTSEGLPSGEGYGPLAGLCLETHGYPNAINEPVFPDNILSPDETYSHSTTYKFANFEPVAE